MTYKIEKVNSLLVEEISKILNLECRRLNLGFITVTAAESAKDIRSARIWISVLNNNKDETLKILNKERHKIQKELNKKIEMKFCPRIFFRLDKSEDNYQKIEKLLKKEKKDLNIDNKPDKV